MDSKLYRQLNECIAEECWTKIRDIVAVQLMGDGVIPVPFLREAESFSLGHVVLKERRTRLEKMTGVVPVALAAGPFSNFVTTTPGQDTLQRLENVKQTSGGRTLNPAYEFHESDMRNGVKKEVTVGLWGCEKWALEYLPHPGEVALDMLSTGYRDFDRVFLVTECYYVNEVKIRLAIADRQDTFLIKGRIPVGFTLTRYRLHPNGFLGSSKPVGAAKWRVHWLRAGTVQQHLDSKAGH